MDGDATGRPRVVILGGGFAGVGAAMGLAASPVDVILIDRHDYRTFQPLLYQLATGMLEPGAVGQPLQPLIEQGNTVVRRATVRSVDLAARTVHVDCLPPVSYDYLVYALGVEPDFSDTEGARRNAFPIYTLPNALRLREHLAARWSSAQRAPAEVADGALNVVVAGGGPTGVEAAGAVAEVYRHRFAHEYPHVDERDARVILVEKGDHLLPGFAPDMRAYAAEELADRTVDIMTGHTVSAVSPTRVALASGQRIKAHTLIWSAGVRNTPVTGSIGVALGETGRIVTGASLDLPEHPEVFAVGDAAAITRSGSQVLLPQLGTIALQSGQHAGEAIARMVAGMATRPFVHREHAPMVTIGHGAAGMQLPDGGAVTGRRAQLAWLTAHLGLVRANERMPLRHADEESE